jgi:undecaprenyl-diphosphatase
VEDVVEKAQLAVAAALRPWYQSSRWGSILLVVYAILLALFALLAWWVSYHPILPIDVFITQQFQENPAPWVHDTMVAVSFIGDVVPLFVGLIALATTLFWIVDLRLEAVMVVALSATSTILNALIKYIVGRPRPASDLVDVMHSTSGSSFPSGHVMSYIAFWGLIFSFTLILFKGRNFWRTTLLNVRPFKVKQPLRIGEHGRPEDRSHRRNERRAFPGINRQREEDSQQLGTLRRKDTERGSICQVMMVGLIDPNAGTDHPKLRPVLGDDRPDVGAPDVRTRGADGRVPALADHSSRVGPHLQRFW